MAKAQVLFDHVRWQEEDDEGKIVERHVGEKGEEIELDDKALERLKELGAVGDPGTLEKQAEEAAAAEAKAAEAEAKAAAPAETVVEEKSAPRSSSGRR
jgi:hypothetical protein